jgi:hypothetical protein
MSKSLMVHCPNFSSSSKREGGGFRLPQWTFKGKNSCPDRHSFLASILQPPSRLQAPPSTMSSALYSFISSITNNITSRYDVKSQIASAGLWKIYSANRKTTGQQVAIFVSFW